jgi:DNA-binding transcriptional MerR regulator
LTDKKVRKKQNQFSKKKVLVGLTSRDVIELIESVDNVKLTFDKLYYYESTGLIIPGIRQAKGKGIKRLYSVRDVIVLRWLVNLNKNGISVQNFRNVVNFLKIKMPQILKKPQNWELITSGKSVQFFDKINSRTLDVLRDSGQYLFFP